ncbi:ABC transporter ATP-binding protein [Streptomyces tropicalis]|uniref:ATP-binding cassette domain-containing protein n=1 Tax=Streptomyces tropicalis TaxID=3034234 RepID=A0ABT6A105_9ACTN|nr:ATP-binding cassette domain-containing protein [Streptomyces tropicalis]MDF3298329.1 ATP-binding cassette domain-containing protein [Streptomyces tropicalis]
MIQAFGLTSDSRKDRPPAVDDVSFEAQAGRVTALLGTPGAGKTTTLRLMLELQQGRGLAYFRGRPLHRVPHPAREVGVLLGDVPGHPSRTVRGHLRMLCAAAGLPARRADEVLEVVGIVSLRDERLGVLSRGMDRRLGLACVLLTDPHTLVLDDPAGGLSTKEGQWVHAMLRAHANEGGTVLFTTADSREAARTADRVVTLDRGRLAAEQDAAEFARTRLRPRVVVRSPHAARLAALLAKEARTARRSVEVVREEGNRLSVYGSTCADIGEAAFRHGILIHKLADEVRDMGPGAGTASPDAAQAAAEPLPHGAPAAAEPCPAAAEEPSRESGAAGSGRPGARRTESGDRGSGDAPAPRGDRPAVAAAEHVPSGARASHAPRSQAAERAHADSALRSDEGRSAPGHGSGDGIGAVAEGAVRARRADGRASGHAESVAAGARRDTTSSADARTVGVDTASSASTRTGRPDAAPAGAASPTPRAAGAGAGGTALSDGAATAAGRAHGSVPSVTGTPSGISFPYVTGTPSGISFPYVTGTPSGISFPSVADVPSDGDRPHRGAHQASPTATRTSQTAGIPTPRPADTAPPDLVSSLPPPISVRPGPKPLRPLRYELRRATGISTGFLISAAVLGVSALIALVLGRLGHTAQPRLLAAWPDSLPLPPAALGAGLLGALAFGDEFRHPALAADRGSVPRRLGLLTAKLLVATFTGLLLAFLTVGCDAEVLYLAYGRELTEVPGDWLAPTASWTGLVVGCAWAGVLAAGLFRSTTAGLAAVVAVPVLVVPVLAKVLTGANARAAAGLPFRLRRTFLLQWPFGGDRYLAAAVRVVAQPVGGALTLSLVALLSAYLLTTLRNRAG